MRCIENIKDITLDCLYKPSRGLRNRILLIPYSYIDRRYTTFNSQRSEIANLQLKVDKKGVLIETKNSFKVKGSQKLSGGFIHEVSLKIDKVDSVNLAVINSLTRGSYVVIVETSGNTFEVLGYDAGMTLSNVQRDYAGNVIGITFTTPNDVKELRMPAIWNESNYIVMSSKFERNAFVGKNYILKSKAQINKYTVFNMSQSFNKDVVNSDFIVLSADITFVNLTNVGKLGIEIKIEYEDGSNQIFNIWKNVTEKDLGSSFSKRMHSVVRQNNKGKKIKKTPQLGAYIFCTADILSISNPKLELNNVATDWCPANED